jgi:Trypsin-co-occurring domain 1
VIVELHASDDEVMLFDVTGAAGAGGRKVAVERGDGLTVVAAERGLEQALDQARRTAASLLQIVATHEVDEAELRFGLRLTGEAGLFAITKIGGEAHCEIVLKWKRREPDEREPAQ